jgi:hypothetical protein
MPHYSDGLLTKLAASGILDAFDTDGRVNLYDGSLPATPATAAAGTLLGTLTLAADSASAGSAAGEVVFNTVTNDEEADASGRAQYGRIYRASDTAPGSAGDSDDRRLDFTVGGETLLNGAINNSVTTIPVDRTSAFATSGELLIGSERITYTGKTSTTFTGCTRGANGSSAASHSDNDLVVEYDKEMTIDRAVVAGGVIAISAITLQLLSGV